MADQRYSRRWWVSRKEESEWLFGMGKMLLRWYSRGIENNRYFLEGRIHDIEERIYRKLRL
jgi:hypothetical protein